MFLLIFEIMAFDLFIFHLFGWCESIVAIFIYHYYMAKLSRKESYGGDWKFLTYINLHVQLLCFTLCLFTDILHYMKFKTLARKLQQIKDVVYACIGIPSCLTVIVTFWALFFIDRELVYPVALDKVLPFWSTHVFHSLIAITLLEVIVDHHEYPKRSFGLSICFSFGIVYIFWLEWVYRQSGVAVYRVLAELKGMWYFLFLVVEIFFTWLTYLLGEYLNRFGRTTFTHNAKVYKKMH